MKFYEITMIESVQAETVEEAARMFLVSSRKRADITETDIYGEPNGENGACYFQVSNDANNS